MYFVLDFAVLKNTFSCGSFIMRALIKAPFKAVGNTCFTLLHMRDFRNRLCVRACVRVYR